MRQILIFSLFFVTFFVSCSKTKEEVKPSEVKSSSSKDGKKANTETASTSSTQGDIISNNETYLKDSLIARITHLEATSGKSLFKSQKEKEAYIDNLLTTSKEEMRSGEVKYNSVNEVLSELEDKILNEYRTSQDESLAETNSDEVIEINDSELENNDNSKKEDESVPIVRPEPFDPNTAIKIVNKKLDNFKDMSNIDRLKNKSKFVELSEKFDDSAILYVYRQGKFRKHKAKKFVKRNLSSAGVFRTDLKFVAPLYSYEKSNYDKFIKKMQDLADSNGDCDISGVYVSKGDNSSSIKAVILGKASDVSKFEECWNSL
jgi:uncharacterized protein YbcV (DUF1398 family)